MKIFKIKELNSILGIQNSCHSKIFTEEETTQIIEKIYPMYDELCRIFNVKEQILKPDIDIQKQKRTKVKFVLDQIFQKWNGSNFCISAKKQMKNGKRKYQYSFHKNLCGIKIGDKEMTIINLIG